MAASNDKVLLEIKGLSKAFPGVQALESVDLDIREGEVHALLGENGAGKSTLIKILSGAYPKDRGEILYQGKPIEIKTPHHAQQLGISTIYQEFNLGPDLTVPENIFLGHLPHRGPLVDWGLAKTRAEEILNRLGIKLPMDVPASKLTVAEQQLVEIAKALARETRLLIMDEPSAVLGDKDLEKLYQIIRALKAEGIAIIYISHRLVEIFDIADRVTVLKDGRLVGTRDVADVTMPELVRMMIGRDLQDVYPKRTAAVGDVLMEVNNINRPGVLHDISFHVRAGEIVGIAGMRGAGRTELARAIFGADPHQGTITLAGESLTVRSPQDAIRHRVALVTEDRKAEGLFLKLSVSTNTTISGLKALCQAGIIRLRRETGVVARLIDQLKIKAPNANFIVGNMSGGNQQKVVLARWLNIGARVLLMDEPTRGIDVGSKAEIYQLMAQLAEQGVGLIMISSELPEVLGMSDRVLVMHEGKLVKELSRAEASEESIMVYATGSHTQAAMT
ncbi:MAG: sugar ABC transporter ATP-binding protein [Chloroflexi bacterium]|nr:sugar ABC transporter ATP-binding protein [Chloroflexota bacterium]